MIQSLNKDSTENKEFNSYKCEKCTSTFSSKNSLEIHTSFVHEGKNSFKFEKYALSFKSQPDLKFQIKIVL